MRQDWTNQDVARLNFLIKENGKNDGIKLFAKESKRTENSIRSKLGRINKEKLIEKAEDQAYKDDAPIENIGWFRRIINAFHNIW